MRMEYRFSTLKDISSNDCGQSFVHLLESRGVKLEKAGNYEPARKAFAPELLRVLWEPHQPEDEFDSRAFVFKGTGTVNVGGMVSWYRNTSPGTRVFNGVRLVISRADKNDPDYLVRLGDDLFSWAEAEYGFITSQALCDALSQSGWIQDAIPGLFWVNYFGAAYLAEEDFGLPENHERVGSGIRVRLCHSCEDARLTMDHYSGVKVQIGSQWFGESPGRAKVPGFDYGLLHKQT